jgi:hypothetical protein
LKLDNTYKKALTYQALAAANASELTARLGGPLSMQMDSAIFTKFYTDASDRQSEANKMYSDAIAKGRKITTAELAQMNALVEQANGAVHQMNALMVRNHVARGGKPEDAPQLPDVPSYYFDKTGDVIGGFLNLIVGAVSGQGATSGTVTRGGVSAPRAMAPGSAAGVGVPTQQPGGSIQQRNTSGDAQMDALKKSIQDELGF